MVFSSLTFLFLFLPILFLLYFPIRNIRWRNGVLIFASLLFYGWGEPVYILAMLFSTVVNFFCARAVEKAKEGAGRKIILAIGVVASLLFLFYFKYAAFLLNSFASLFGSAYRMQTPELPIGISFYTFQILTYTVDVYRGKQKALKNPFTLLLYVSCFPQLIAGPIVQYSDVADSLMKRKIRPNDFIYGMSRFGRGLAKKVLLANICGAALEALPQAGTGASLSVAGAWLGALLYSLQLYFDFSAYSDMAIGLGKCIGFTYKENFNFPYISSSVTEFWRRWHISLGSFFRDYVYIPLGGNRCSVGRHIFNMMVVWMLTGLWHGADWNFVLWGVYYGVLLILEKYPLRRLVKNVPAFFRWLVTLPVVIIGWVIFYYTDLSAVFEHLGAMFGSAPAGLIDAQTISVLKQYTVFPLLAFVLSLPLIPAIGNMLCKVPVFKKCSVFVSTLLSMLLLLVSAVFLIGQSYNPFIYFRF